MKTVYESPVGGDGAKAGLYVEDGCLALKATYPMEKVIKPITDVIDMAIDKIEELIPGDWDKALLDPVKAEAKAAILKMLTE